MRTMGNFFPSRRLRVISIKREDVGRVRQEQTGGWG